MNSKAPYKEFEVDIDKAIDMFSNMSKCLDKKWNVHYEFQCDKKCDECDYMYGAGNSGQIKNAFENVQEWLEELKFIRQWKSDVMDDFCKYDCNSIEEVRNNAYNKAIDDYNKELKDYLRKFTVHYVSDKDFDYIAEQLKGSGENEN